MAVKDITDKQVIEAYLECKRIGEGWPYDILQDRTGQCWKVCYRAMERSCKRGYIDYGVSLRSGWVTPLGLKVLDNSLSTDSGKRACCAEI